MRNLVMSCWRNSKIIFSILLLSVAMSSCEEDDDQPDTPATKTQMLTGKNWRLTAWTVSPARAYTFGAAETSDWYAQMTDCERDDLKKYNADGTVIYDEGAAKCDNDDPQTTNGTWLFNPNETIVTETNPSEDDGSIGETTSYTVVQLTANTYKVTYTQDFFGTTYTFTRTYTAQ